MVTEILGDDRDAYNLDCDDFKGTHEHQNLSNFTLKYKFFSYVKNTINKVFSFFVNKQRVAETRQPKNKLRNG